MVFPNDVGIMATPQMISSSNVDSGSINWSGGKSVNLTTAFSVTGKAAGTNISFTLNQVINPLSTKTSNPFSIYVYSSDNFLINRLVNSNLLTV